MKKKHAENQTAATGKFTFSKIISFILLFTLLATTGLLGFIIYKQENRIKDRDTELAKADSALNLVSEDAVSLNKEISDLKAALADSSPYLAEDDITQTDALPKISEEETEPPSSDTEKEEKDAEPVSNKETPAQTAYQKKYKDLYRKEDTAVQGKVVHLTFDDGPSQNTPKVLDILDKYDIKATFFVVYNDESPACDYYKEIVKRGHTLAIHTASHNYKQIYASVDAYLEDFNKIYTYVYEQTGVRPALFRYPGGSTNCLSYQAGADIMAEMERRGFIYYDWNVSSGDGGNQATRSSIYEWVTSKAVNLNESVVLMHDSGGKGETVAALPNIIDRLLKAGCTFEPLTPSTKPVQFQNTKKKKN